LNRWFRKTFNALSVREYRYLWLGSLFTFAGMQMSIIARGFLAYDLTGSNGALGAVTFGFAIPMLCLSLWGGVVADRVAKRRLLMIFQSTVALNSAWIATMVATDLIEFWMLIVSSVIQGVVFSFIGPARMAFTTDLIGKERLANAIALQQLSMRSTQVVGPALAGVLIGVPLVGVAGL
jgi:MFS family permease